MSKGDLNQLLENENMLQWVWAANEQHYLFDKHDAYWINEAATGWTDEGFYQFLKTYRLLRGKVGALFAKGTNNRDGARADFIRLCNKHFKPEISGNSYLDEAQKRWSTVRSELKNKLLCINSNEDDTDFMPSATLKAFWFHHPDKLPMYDQFTLKGLKKQKKGTDLSTFLCNFYEFYHEHESHIDDAEAYFSRTYPYRHRVAEKFLWLEGNPKAKKEALERFKAALAMRKARNEA
jgi:hypothetical protein